MTRQLILSGDDFGLAVPVNEAIEQAYQRGSLTTTSLLIGGRAVGDAIVRARRNPGLRVGLHVAVCEGHPLLPPCALGALVDRRGELRSPLLALACLLLPWLWRPLEAEIRAQFAAFARTGLALDHVNGHNHMQLHPVVLAILLRVAGEYGSPPIRTAHEPLLPSLRAAGFRRTLARVPWLAMRPWHVYVKRRLARAGFQTNDYLFGIYDCGRLELPLLLGFIEHLPDGLSEIHCHPSTRRCAEIDRTMPKYQHQAELAALTSAPLRAAIDAGQISLVCGFRAAFTANRQEDL